MKGKTIYQWMIDNGLTLQDFEGIDPMFFMDSNYLIYDTDLSDYGDYTGLAVGPNFRSVKGNRQDIAEKVGVPVGQRGVVFDTKRIAAEAKKHKLDPKELLINRAKHEWHHSANDGMPGISESMAYGFGDGIEFPDRGKVPFRLNDEWREYARTMNDPRDLWEMLPEPKATSSAWAAPEKPLKATSKPATPALGSRVASSSTSSFSGR